VKSEPADLTFGCVIPYVTAEGRRGVTPRQKLMVIIPIIAVVVIVLVYFQLFANPLVIVLIFILYVAVSLRNKRKFNRQEGKPAKGARAA